MRTRAGWDADGRAVGMFACGHVVAGGVATADAFGEGGELVVAVEPEGEVMARLWLQAGESGGDEFETALGNGGCKAAGGVAHEHGVCIHGEDGGGRCGEVFCSVLAGVMADVEYACWGGVAEFALELAWGVDSEEAGGLGFGFVDNVEE